MEAKFGGKPPVHRYYGAVGKRRMEWDLNEWKWDGDLFAATPSRQLFPPVQINNSGSASNTGNHSVENNLQNEKEKRELEKKRRVMVLDEEEEEGTIEALNLKLGGQVHPITEENDDEAPKSGKKSKVGAVCQVDDCRTDLSNAKDYHRRHKVCELHSKVTNAFVLNVMQRFCQQCSRFHALEEFDEGKRSCRRRLAGHNRRRRKTHPENTVNGVSANDESSTSNLLISLLKLLSNIQSNTSDQRNEQGLVTQLLRSLGGERHLLAGSQDFTNAETSVDKEAASRPALESESVMHDGGVPLQTPNNNNSGPPRSTVGKMKLNNIDLNNAYDDSQESFNTPNNIIDNNNNNVVPMWLRSKSSPPQTSANSGSTATQSPSSSSSEASQSRTDRIVFKLFGKDPNNLPGRLRNQILDWLSQSPTDIEGYIRPGCIILSVYLRMDNSSWDQLCYDLSTNLRKLLEASSDSFWRTGWIYTRVLDHVAFASDGRIVLSTALPCQNSSILSVKPIAVSVSENAQFSVKGFNSISWSTSRLMCALEGSYLIQTSCSDVIHGGDSLTFSCSIPNVLGRGFIEIEDEGLSSSFFPFIVAEENVCLEIRTLENDIDAPETCDTTEEIYDKKLEAKIEALEFINEIGWLLHRSHLKSRLSSSTMDDANSNLFSFERFTWLMEFSVDRDWCCVVNKLLNLIFNGKVIDTAEHTSVEAALVDMGLLHRAVRRNSRPMVELLLNFSPSVNNGSVLFKPDAVGPAGLTPLHVAAGKDGSEHVLDALTDDPQLVGVEAWRKSRDSSGLTPYDYASLRGHYAYIQMVQRKINRTRSEKGQVVVDIPSGVIDKIGGFETEKGKGAVVFTRQRQWCNGCEDKLRYYYGGGGRLSSSSLAMYKPAMLSMVAIAAVCVCVALLFKSSPQVMYVFQPFIWERLKYGAS